MPVITRRKSKEIRKAATATENVGNVRACPEEMEYMPQEIVALIWSNLTYPEHIVMRQNLSVRLYEEHNNFILRQHRLHWVSSMSANDKLEVTKLQIMELVTSVYRILGYTKTYIDSLLIFHKSDKKNQFQKAILGFFGNLLQTNIPEAFNPVLYSVTLLYIIKEFSNFEMLSSKKLANQTIFQIRLPGVAVAYTATELMPDAQKKVHFMAIMCCLLQHNKANVHYDSTNDFADCIYTGGWVLPKNKKSRSWLTLKLTAAASSEILSLLEDTLLGRIDITSTTRIYPATSLNLSICMNSNQFAESCFVI